MRIFFAFFLLTVITVKAQVPQVPHKMQFAGMTLTIHDDARKEIQKDVNALTQSPKHHNIKVERAKTYFPIIEKVFEEERIPEDFKYLVLQESALIADAVSVSNAVGFWQFKDYTAMEMGLRVDKEIDERLNIVSSSRAAARYIKKNNFHFNNWIFALQAYQMGAGGAMKSLPNNLSGAKQMDITSKTYWYVKKFIAHKVAFEEAVKGEGQVRIVPYENRSKKLLTDIAHEVSVNEDDLKSYNKWVKAGHIPDDRSYTVIIPMIGDGKEFKLPEAPLASKAQPTREAKLASVQASRIKINGIKAIKAEPGETATSLASRAGVQISEFLKWNDISGNTPIESNKYYLLGKKRTRAVESFHVVTSGETLWQVSQRYGVRLNKLRRYNRMSSQDEIQPGVNLWLSSRKPRDADKANSIEPVEVENKETFAWTVDDSQSEGAVVVNVQPKAVEKISMEPEKEVGPLQETVDSLKYVVDSSKTLQPQSPGDAIASDSTEVNTNTRVHQLQPDREHVVKTGETLYGIAHAYNVTVMDLVHWNNLNLQEGIKAGQVLLLHEVQIIEDQPIVYQQIEHEVKTTDTLYSIARKYGVTIKQLMEWNDKKDFGLSVGEKLKIQAK